MGIMKLVLVLVLCTIYITSTAAGNVLKKDMFAPVPQIISSYGYPSERHRAHTEDGYVLQLHRIPAGRRSIRRSGEPRAKGKKAVLLVSGLLGSSGDFVIMGPDRSLSFILADAGYDVWVGNLRGDMYTAHKNLTRRDPAFWDYSFHEHGKYDLPAMIDRILNITGLPKLLYIGYSMGTTSFFTMMSQRPEYNEKIVAFVALAPAVYLDNIKETAHFLLNELRITETFRKQGILALTVNQQLMEWITGSVCNAKAPQYDMCMRMTYMIVGEDYEQNDWSTLRKQGILALTVNQQLMEWITGSVCNAKAPQYDMCMRMTYMIVGEDYEQNDWDMSQIIMARFQPASWRQLEHFGKIAITGVFTSWEDGLNGAVKPYNLSNVKVPVTLLYGENDQLTTKDNILKLAAQLNSTGVLESVRPGCSWPKFNHLDFAFAKDIGTLLNKPLVKHINYLYSKYGAL
ncbi:alpha/beta hydrolase fold domain-containing protein [Phthorimaea operculella]|nr:alpha/beta hydrolase fold domain-containing protein [Phthorimaea operculella]